MSETWSWVPVIQTAAATVIALGIGGIFRHTARIRDDLARLNGRLTKIETWAKGHEQLDEERHKGDDARYESLGCSVKALREDFRSSRWREGKG